MRHKSRYDRRDFPFHAAIVGILTVTLVGSAVVLYTGGGTTTQQTDLELAAAARKVVVDDAVARARKETYVPDKSPLEALLRQSAEEGLGSATIQRNGDTADVAFAVRGGRPVRVRMIRYNDGWHGKVIP